MIALEPIPDLSPADRALLLALIDPTRPVTQASVPSDPSNPPPDPLSAAAFLARPDIQPHLAALQALFAFRRQIELEHRTNQFVDSLLDTARNAPDYTQRRLAATTALRALHPTPPPRRGSPSAPCLWSPRATWLRSPSATRRGTGSCAA
jgi:hypothetical protein